MPLFMFISGYLFNLTKINKNKTYYSVLKEKSIKLLIPYFVPNIFYVCVKVSFSKIDE